MVCSEVNLTSVPRHTWWIDSSAITHINMSTQGCLNRRKPSDDERYIHIGYDKIVEVGAIGKHLFFYISKAFIILSCRRNFFSISALSKYDFLVHLGMENLVSHDSKLVSSSFCQVMTIFIRLTQLHHLMHSCNQIHNV